jgi:hypothetical protein
MGLLGRLAAVHVADRDDEVRRLGADPGDPDDDRDLFAAGQERQRLEPALGGRTGIAQLPPLPVPVTALLEYDHRADPAADRLLAADPEHQAGGGVSLDHPGALVDHDHRLAAPSVVGQGRAAGGGLDWGRVHGRVNLRIFGVTVGSLEPGDDTPIRPPHRIPIPWHGS